MNKIQSYESRIVWEEGVPRVKLQTMVTKEVLTDLPVAALSLPYKRSDKDIFLERELEFEGKTNAEVMNIRLARKAAAGNTDAAKTIQDRILGKPKQQVESHSITETYSQWLDRTAVEQKEVIKEAEINDKRMV